MASGLVVFVALAPSFSIHDGRPGRQGELTPLSMMTRWKVSAEEVVRACRSHQRQRSRGTAGIHVDGVVGEDPSPFPPRLPPIWLSSFDHQKGDDAGGSRHLAPFTSPEFLLVFTGPPRSLPRQIFNSELSGVLLPWGVFLGLPAPTWRRSFFPPADLGSCRESGQCRCSACPGLPACRPSAACRLAYRSKQSPAGCELKQHP